MRNCSRTLHRREFLLAAGAGVASSLALQGVEPSLAPTPPMGWMSWNQFGPDVSEKLVLEVAGVLVSSGMKDLGYKYVCLDDYWCTSRDAKGQMQPNPRRFPSGMKLLADHLHSKGLKLGVYSDAGDKTCGGNPGSFGREEQDAELFASWSVDYLKYDYCNAPEDRTTAIQRYSVMARALRKTGRPIVFAVCEWGERKPWEWAASAGGQLWRTTWDVRDLWYGSYDDYHLGVLNIIDHQIGLENYSGPGHWNDLDMLVVGLDGKGRYTSPKGFASCTDTEYQTQMSFWCLLNSPLMISCDVRRMKDASRQILTNVEVIAINQDRLGRQGRSVKRNENFEIWEKPLADGRVVALLNRGNSARTVPATWMDLGLNGKQRARDLWLHRDLGDFESSISVLVQSHETVLLKLRSVR